jgi:hypothetical protein
MAGRVALDRIRMLAEWECDAIDEPGSADLPATGPQVSVHVSDVALAYGAVGSIITGPAGVILGAKARALLQVDIDTSEPLPGDKLPSQSETPPSGVEETGEQSGPPPGPNQP